MRRAPAICALVVLLAGCGDDDRRQERFHSRPDLNPPRVHVTGRAGGYVFLAPKRDARQRGLMILDRDGKLVWYHPVSPEATDFRVQTYRGQPVLTWWRGHSAHGFGQGEFVIASPEYDRIHVLHAANGLRGDEHEFTLTARGTALVIAYRKVGELWEGVVQELDVETGRLVFDWHSVPHVAASETYIPLGNLPKGSILLPGDYFHANAVDLDTDGNLLVSARNTSTIYKVDRNTGRVIWRLGGKRSDFRMGPGTRFWWQHDARRQADGTITVFDNGAAPPKEKRSRALKLRVDEDAMTVTLVRQWTHPKRLLASSQGNAQFVPDGHVFVGWGADPYATELDAHGRVLFDLRLPKDVDSYRAYRFDWNGHPATAPAIAVRRKDLDENYVYASWNGATEVARWRVLADGKRVRSAPKDGFETRIAVPRGADRYAVEALAADGRVLSRSDDVEPDE